jgi:hypothetical protein
MHHSRLCAVLIDCKTSDVDEAACFWAEALGRPIDPGHPNSRGNYRMLETPPDVGSHAWSQFRFATRPARHPPAFPAGLFFGRVLECRSQWPRESRPWRSNG